jgi:hypothetical protein
VLCGWSEKIIGEHADKIKRQAAEVMVLQKGGLVTLFENLCYILSS